MEGPIEVVRKYLQAWDAKDQGALRRHFADDVVFKGPMGEVRGGDAVSRSASNMFPVLQNVDIRDLAEASGNVVIAVYDFVCAEPIGICRTAERCVVSAGLIKETELFFDPRPFIALAASRSPQQV
jgi:ketosteroid isomerase-like protein